MHKNPVHAQESFACTRFLCMHNNLVHAQDSFACTGILCMHRHLLIDGHLIASLKVLIASLKGLIAILCDFLLKWVYFNRNIWIKIGNNVVFV